MKFTSETGRLAGQKSKRGPTERSRVLNELFTEETAKAIFVKLEDLALTGNMDAIKTYLSYCFGKPEAKLDITTDGESINQDLSRLSTEDLNTLRKIKESLEN